jgi:hypothetical protein
MRQPVFILVILPFGAALWSSADWEPPLDPLGPHYEALCVQGGDALPPIGVGPGFDREPAVPALGCPFESDLPPAGRRRTIETRQP